VAFVTKTVQKRPPRPYKPKDFRRMSKYCVDDGGIRGDVLGYTLVGCGYNLGCIYASAQKLFKDNLVATKEIKDTLQAAIIIIESLLVSSVFIKLLGFIRRPLQSLLTLLKALDKLLDDFLEAVDVCEDYLELIDVIKKFRGNDGDISG